MRNHSVRENFLFIDPSVEGCIKGEIWFSNNFTTLSTTENFEKLATSSFFETQSVKIKRKNITHFSKQSNHMMLEYNLFSYRKELSVCREVP